MKSPLVIAAEAAAKRDAKNTVAKSAPVPDEYLEGLKAKKSDRRT